MTPAEHRPRARAAIQTWARVAGFLFLLSFVAGGFGEAYVPSLLIVATDAAATAHNIKAFDFLFRLSFAGYLVEAVCDIALALIFYELLKPAGRTLALLAAFFGLLSTALFAVTEIFYFAAPKLILGGAGYLKTFSPEQLDTLALLSLKLFVYGSAMFTVFYGIGWILRGYLIFRSGYLPRLLGLLMMLGGLAFVARNFALVLAPQYPSANLLLALFPGGLLLAFWLLVRGVNVAKWEALALSLAKTNEGPR
ncbi:MAG TPA: DUF4386 domain-containing protein [Rhizomicrobium sp.]